MEPTYADGSEFGGKDQADDVSSDDGRNPSNNSVNKQLRRKNR